MSFYGVTDIATYTIGAIGIILLPGPVSLFVLTVASQKGVRSGYQAAYGVFIGDTVLITLTALGAASLFQTLPNLFNITKYIGAVYLGYMGLKLIWAAWQGWAARNAPVAHSGAVANDARNENYLQKALVISMMNPKALLFLLSFFTQFVDPTYPNSIVPLAILGGIVMILSFTYLSILIFAGSKLAAFFSKQHALKALLSASVGCMFLGFGFKLATAKL